MAASRDTTILQASAVSARRAQGRGRVQVLDDAGSYGGGDLARGHETGEQGERRLEPALEAGMNGGEELVEARQAAGLVLGEVAAPADQDTDGDCRLVG